jgi:hypothetical protein
MTELLLFIIGAVIIGATTPTFALTVILATAYGVGLLSLVAVLELRADVDGVLVVGATLLLAALSAAAVGHAAACKVVRGYRGKHRRYYYS